MTTQDQTLLKAKAEKYEAISFAFMLLTSFFGSVVFYMFCVRTPYYKMQCVFESVVVQDDVIKLKRGADFFIVSEYDDIKSLNTLCNQPVVVEYMCRYGRNGRNKKIGDFLVSIKDTKGSALPYSKPYNYLPWEYNNVLLIVCFCCSMVFLFCSIVANAQKNQIKKEIGNIES